MGVGFEILRLGGGTQALHQERRWVENGDAEAIQLLQKLSESYILSQF
jgi:hypothetical protein